jgi:subtilisin family serine protease
VDIHHQDLSERVIKHVNLVKHDQYRGEIHGTAMAGVVLASINQFGIAGVAPQADLIALRACRQVSENHPEGRCTTTSVSKALDMAITQKAQIVNMSFGASVPDFLLIQLFNEGAKRNVLFVASVGNQQDTTKISFPASHPQVISVAGVDGRGNGYPNAALASAARVCAPAKEVLTTLPGDRFNIMSGTSISAAVVSGILTLAKEKNRKLSIRTLPDYNGDLCLWQQALLNLPVCK